MGILSLMESNKLKHYLSNEWAGRAVFQKGAEIQPFENWSFFVFLALKVLTTGNILVKNDLQFSNGCISQPPFEIQLNRTTRFEGMVKEKNIHLVIQRENVRGASNRVCV